MDEDPSCAIARGEALVAAHGESVVGFATMALPRAASAPTPAPARAPATSGASLVTVAVDPHHQGKGIGRALIAAVEARARAAGAAHLRLYTNAAMAANLSLYPHLGFVETARRHEDGFDRVFFEKALAPAMAVRPAALGLYGRRKGQGRAVPDPADPLLLDLGVPFAPALFSGARALRLEVGFGGGEHLIHHARAVPDVGLIGVEPFETGLARALSAARAQGLRNVRFCGADARAVLAWLPAGALERVDILYPDPWHKKKHWKRRFISAEGLDVLARALSPGATVRFASDIESYVHWTRQHVAAHRAFSLAADSGEPWHGWPGTRYEAKALREGRTPRYLTLLRR